ncbi:hypothetical protein ACFX13_029179 [Malus domestica]
MAMAICFRSVVVKPGSCSGGSATSTSTVKFHCNNRIKRAALPSIAATATIFNNLSNDNINQLQERCLIFPSQGCIYANNIRILRVASFCGGSCPTA